MSPMLTLITSFSDLSICIRLILATAMGGLIGYERGARGQPAGTRTFSLVCLGACLTMITNEYISHIYYSVDISRFGAQVISGMGFLGAGTILVTGRNYVKGLTTAATLWTTACLGLAIGSGYLTGSLVAFVLIFFVITALSIISHKVEQHNRKIRLYVELSKSTGTQPLLDIVKRYGYKIRSMEKQPAQAIMEDDFSILLNVDLNSHKNHYIVLEQFQSEPNIHYIEEIK